MRALVRKQPCLRTGHKLTYFGPRLPVQRLRLGPQPHFRGFPMSLERVHCYHVRTVPIAVVAITVVQ